MPWDPEQYLKFRKERSLPFDDLFSLIEVREGLSVVDLGCGTGELTRRLADRLPGSRVLGIDSSPKMMELAKEQERPGLSFEYGDIQTVTGKWDLLFSNAAIQWVDNHEYLMPRLMSLLSPCGQLALQLPSNHRHPSMTMINETAGEEPFFTALYGWLRIPPILEIDSYARLLYDNGGTDIVAFEKVYCHILDDADDVLEWTRGTALVPYLERLPVEFHLQFLECYREKLWKVWPRGPVFFTFRRIFMAAKKKK